MTEQMDAAHLPIPDAPASDAELREVALSRAEYHQAVEMLGRYPTRVELGMIGAMWSEHCGYKHSRPLFKMFPTTGPRVLQGPGENAGVVDIGDGLALVLKMESHNHPSAVEPYQGAATGVGGIVRDIFTMGARPVAILDALRFGPLDEPRNRYLFGGVVAGIGGYGNSLGIPTVGGDINFHPSYRGNPLVNAMCVGIAPQRGSRGRARASRQYAPARRRGDGARRHPRRDLRLRRPRRGGDGAAARRAGGQPVPRKAAAWRRASNCWKRTMSSGCRTSARPGITSSAVECAGRAGAGIEIDVQKVARRERGMTAYEVMLSESQERMLVIVKPEAVERVRARFARWELHADVIGLVTDDGRVRVRDGERAGRRSADARSSPRAARPIRRPPPRAPETIERRAFDPRSVPDIAPVDVVAALTQLLGHPDIASKRPVWETYDSTIGTNTVLGPGGGDAAVLRVRGTRRGIALTTDCNARYCGLDPVSRRDARHRGGGAQPRLRRRGAGRGHRLPQFRQPRAPGDLLPTARGGARPGRRLPRARHPGRQRQCQPLQRWRRGGDPADADGRHGGRPRRYRPTRRHGLPRRCDARAARAIDATTGASIYLATVRGIEAGAPPPLDLETEAAVQSCVREAIRSGHVQAAHDLADGGLAVALAEGCIAGRVGCEIDAARGAPYGGGSVGSTRCSSVKRHHASSSPSRRRRSTPSKHCAATHDVPVHILGRTTETPQFSLHGVMNVPLHNLINSMGNGPGVARYTASRSYARGASPMAVRKPMVYGMTYDEYCLLPNDGKRYQVIEGEFDRVSLTELPSSRYRMAPRKSPTYIR